MVGQQRRMISIERDLLKATASLGLWMTSLSGQEASIQKKYKLVPGNVPGRGFKNFDNITDWLGQAK